MAPGKPLAAFCLMAMEPQGLSREELVLYLWPDTPTSKARSSARQVLHVLRKVLGPNFVEETDGRLSISPERYDSDLNALARRLSAGDLEGAHELWQGGPFANFTVATAPAFNDWGDRHRSRWERQLGEALVRKAALARNEGRAEDALRWLQRAVDVRPFDERSHAERVELLLECGRLEDAALALEQGRAVVDEPTLLEEASARLDAAWLARHPVGAEEGTPAYPALQFVGRNAEMTRLRSAWRTTLMGKPATVAVVGEAGIGKSRLVEEFVRYIVGRDVTVVRAKALDTERGLRLGLVAEVAKALAGKPGAAGIANASLTLLQHLVPTLGNGHPSAPAGELSDVAVSEALLDLVEAVGGEAPLLLWIEDLQWADAQSRTVLLRGTRSLRGVAALAVITCRSGDADLSAVHALRSEAAAGRLTAMELSPLSLEEIHEAVALSLDVRPPEAAHPTAARLAAASQGNPLFLAELIHHLHSDGLIVEDEGHWVLHAAGIGEDLPLPNSVREILEGRLRNLPSELVEILGRVAHARRTVTAEECAAAADVALPVVEGALRALMAYGILMRDPLDASSEVVVFTHDSLRAVARDLIPPPAQGLVRRVPWWGWVAASAALVAIAVLGWMKAPADPPLYPGVLYVTADGAVQRFRAPTRRGEAWDTLPPIPLPEGVAAAQLAPNAAGGLDAYGLAYSEAGVPRVVRILGDGRMETLLEHDGDVTAGGLSPDGRYMLLSVADESSGAYRVNLVRYEIATGRTLTLVAPEDRAFGLWGAGGDRISVDLQGVPDSVIVLRPDGVRLEGQQRPHDQMRGVWPCGPSDDVWGKRWVDGRLTIGRLDFPDGVASAEISVPLRPVGHMRCSPDGKAAGTVVKMRGENRLMVLDLTTGDTLLGPSLRDPTGFGWTPERQPVLPARVRAEPDTVRLEWGQSQPIRAMVSLGDGTPHVGDEVAWEALEPAVASVRDGRIYANGTGTARAVASVRGWITDTVTVFVTGSSPGDGALLADPFQRLDSAVWAAFGDAVPQAVMDAGTPALDLDGDGVGADGVFTRRTFDLSRGATLELSFKLPLTRRDRQVLTVCLSSGTAPREAASQDNASTGEQVCFSHPAEEGGRFDPEGFYFTPLPSIAPVQHSSLLPADEWRRLSMVLSADGHGRLLIDQQEVARLPWPLDNGPEVRWFLQISGRAVDTRALIRDLVLWEGVRY